MSHAEFENQGTGLGEVFDILVKTPSERLLSLTFQLGDSPEDCVILALCLIILQREEQALQKLQMLRGNPLANHLSQKCCTNGGKLEDFGVHCGRFQAQTEESLSLLARIFKVLSEKRLCELFLRNLAYKRALSSDCLKTSSSNQLQYHQFREEVKDVCGPQFADWMSSSTDLKLEFFPDPKSLIEGNTTLKASLSQDELSSHCCVPSPLQESPSELSYPTHLEISVPPTCSFQGEKEAQETPGTSTPNAHNPHVSEREAKNEPGKSQPPKTEERFTDSPPTGAGKDSMMDNSLSATSSNVQTEITQDEIPTQPNTLSTETHFNLPSAKDIFIPAPKNTNCMVGEEEEEDIFYAFVILHAPEDEEVAQLMKEKVETAIGSKGATFSEEFAILGKSTLSCVEDAINNSAFTFLLLTRNFNTRMLEMKTNIALINSINYRHKFNTVIPLLPADNCMHKQDIPKALQALVQLDERKSFKGKLQKSLSSAKIEKQRKIWSEEQKLRKLRNLRLQEADRRRLLMEQKLLLEHMVPVEPEGDDSRALWPSQPNIHIENARYVMIGNDSKMNVTKNSSVQKEEEQ